MVKKFQAFSISEIVSENGLIPIFPAGTTKGVDGRGPYHLKNAADVIAASEREHVDLVIDRDHATDLAPPGTAIVAAGWIKELIEHDGGIWARVEWTPAAEQQLKDREYRYISPTFHVDKATGNVTRILRATLTNSPNFNMKAVASAQRDDETTDQIIEEEDDMNMNKTLLACAAVLGMKAPKTEEDVLELVKATAAALATSRQSLTDTAKALGLKDDEKAETIIAAATSLKTATGKEGTDPSKFVPIETFQETASALAKLQTEITEDKATAAVEAAMKAGKITPAQKAWALDYAKSSLEAFKTFIDGAPVVASAAEIVDTKKKPDANAGLDEEEKAMCSALGVSEDDYKKTRAA